MSFGKGNHCFGTLRSEGRTPPGGCPPSGCPQPGSCPKTWEELLTSHQHLTHGSSGARHFKRWYSISNVLRQYWLKFVQREVKASLLRCYLWRSEQPLLGQPQEEGQTAKTAFLPALLHPLRTWLWCRGSRWTTFLSQSYDSTDNSFMVFLFRMTSYSKARRAKNTEINTDKLKQTLILFFSSSRS